LDISISVDGLREKAGLTDDDLQSGELRPIALTTSTRGRKSDHGFEVGVAYVIDGHHEAA
jgi:hypothetical protein